jgi:hypothetical protein
MSTLSLAFDTNNEAACCKFLFVRDVNPLKCFECFLQAFVYVSTAFSHNEGRKIVDEVLYAPPADPDHILEISNMHNTDEMEAIYQR